MRPGSRCSLPSCSTATRAWTARPGETVPRELWLGAVERALADGRMTHVLENEDVDSVRPLSISPNGIRKRIEHGGVLRKVAIVSGGARGIGRAAARKLAGEGASVVICSDREEQVEETVAALREEGLEVRGVRADVTSSADMKKLMDLASETYGGVDVLVNSAGVQRYGTVVETEEEVWDEVLDVNLKGVYLASRYAIPEMRKRGGGAIVNLLRAGLRLSDWSGGLHGQQRGHQCPLPARWPWITRGRISG